MAILHGSSRRLYNGLMKFIFDDKWNIEIHSRNYPEEIVKLIVF